MKLKHKLKVLVLVDHAKGIDGPHRNVVGTLNALATRKNLEITLLTGDIEKEAKYSSEGKVKIVLGFKPKSPQHIPKNIFYILREIFRNDIVYVPTNLTSWLYALLCGAWTKKFIAGPNVAGIPGLMPIHEPNKIMTTWFLDRWIVNSEIVKYHCMNAGTLEKQIEVIPHSIDTEDFTPEKRDKSIWEKYDLDPDRLKILHVGRANNKLKGVPQLMETFSRLNINNQYDLVYVGSQGEYWDDQYLKIPGVHYLGKIYGGELRKIYASSDIFFAMSLWETFWFTPLEAMSSGLPVVVNAVGAVNEMIPVNGEQGVIIDILNDTKTDFSENVSEIAAEALRTLCNDEPKRYKMGVCARSHIVKTFSEKNLGKKLEEVFRS